MFIAAIDTSCGFSFAVADDKDGLIASCTRTFEPGRRETAEVMPALIKEQLGQVEISAESVRRWTVGTGPGSFTGIRAGISLVAGICRNTGAECRGIPSSSALIIDSPVKLEENDTAAVLNDARQKQLIATFYKRRNNETCLWKESRVINPEKPPPELFSCSCLISVQAEIVGSLLNKELRRKLIPAESLRASSFFCYTDWPAGRGEKKRSLEPIYVRPSVFVSPDPALSRRA